MTNVQTFSSKQEVQQQACEWISRFDRGLSEVEVSAFSDWVNISKTHRQCLFEVAQTWDELSVLNELSTLFPMRDSHLHKTNKWLNRKTMGIAASLVFVVVSCFGWLVNSQFMSAVEEPSLLVLNAETIVGEHRVLSLADGSVIHLNTDSEVSVDFSHTGRNVNLLRGEAHFDVAHDETRPFVVKAANNTVTAVGTAFNVQLDSPQQFELLVTEGKVLVNNKTDSLSGDANFGSSEAIAGSLLGSGELLTAGQKAVITPQSMQHVTLSKEQLQQDLAWQQGMLVFQGEPLVEALQEIGRYTSIDFILADEQVKQRRVAGYFKAGDIQGLLFALENNFNIVYSKNDDQTIILSTGNQRVL